MELKTIPFILSLFVLIGCAGFSYRYYGLAGVDYSKGTLLGPEEKDDIPFSQCAPSPSNRHPCVVMKTGEFYKFKLDYEQAKQKLKQYESEK